MQTADVVLSAIRKCGEKGEPLQRVYRQLFNQELYLLAYGKIYRNAGAATPGPDAETVDGMSIARIEKVINLLRHERYEWKPVRRVYIEKKHSTKKRPLGIPGWNDKLVQEVIRLILEAYYEPQFSTRSHGFRPNRGCGTALTELLSKWDGTKWFIEGDIKGCFDNIDHPTLMAILAEGIHDNRLLRLIEGALKAGYLEDWRWNPSLSGTPQGGIISPILANIYLDRLDKFVEDTLLPAYNRGEIRRWNRAYINLGARIRGRRKSGYKVEEISRLFKLKRTLPCVDPYDPGFRRLKYIRYADDFLLGFAGPHAEAEAIKELLRDFLRDALKLELSQAKTKITHAVKDAARFLGYDVHTAQNDQKLTNKRRAINGRIGLKVPYTVITEKCARYMRNNTPVHLTERLNFDVFDIIEQYQAEYRGFVEYYRKAYNLSKLGRLKQVMEISLTKTLAHKLKISVSQVYQRFARSLPTNEGPRKVLQYVITRENKPLVAQWGNVTLKWNSQATIREPHRFPWDERVQLIDRLRADTCELCGSQEDVEVHHISHMKTLWKAGRNNPPQWIVWMASRRRKTIVVCRRCHWDIHNGRTTVSPFPKNTGKPDDLKGSSPVWRGVDGKVS